MSAQSKEVEQIDYIKPSDLQRDENQPRTYFAPEALQELADDIKVNGVIEPIILYGKAITGETPVTREIKKLYGCKSITDEWDGSSFLHNETLANNRPSISKAQRCYIST